MWERSFESCPLSNLGGESVGEKAGGIAIGARWR
jgi:hypothetical protein